MEEVVQNLNNDRNKWPDEYYPIDEQKWKLLARNPGIFELDYEAIRKRAMIFKEELMEYVYHPQRMEAQFQHNLHSNISHLQLLQ